MMGVFGFGGYVWRIRVSLLGMMVWWYGMVHGGMVVHICNSSLCHIT